MIRIYVYMKKRLLPIVSSVLVMSLILTGCTTKKNETTLTFSDTDIYGKVTAVDSDTITFDVVTVPQNNGGNPPEMPGGDGNQGNPPEKPDGDGNQGNPPEMPSGDNSQGNPPDMPNGAGGLTSTGETETLTIRDTSILYKNENNNETSATISDIAVGKVLKISFDSNNISKIVIYDETDLIMGGGNPGQGGGNQAPTDYTAANTYSSDENVTNKEVSSTGTDENAILVNGGTVSLDKVTVTRDSQDSTGGDSASFYGVGAAILATDGTLNISNSEINTDAAGGAGVFSYGSSVVTVSDTTINTKQNTSGGIHVAGGGTLYANNLTVETNGASAAAIRSDRGGGTMVVNGGEYTSNGTGSPSVYCTADITVKDSTLTATNSEAICIEGKNSLKLYDCVLTGNMPDQEQNDSTWTVILYQSMSGDAEVGSGTFQMSGGKLVSKNGGIFYTTNTTSHFILENVDIESSEGSEYLLACQGNNNSRGWGSAGKNGAECTFTAISQTLDGKVLWDSISKLDFYLTQNSVLTGSFVQDESYAGNGGEGYGNLYIDNTSKWIVTGNSTLTNLYNAGTIVDENGNQVSIVGTDGTVYVEGNSEFSITVSGYSTNVDLSGADTVS